MGPGSRVPGRKRLKENVSCSKTEIVPSIDCTQMKSFPTRQNTTIDTTQNSIAASFFLQITNNVMNSNKIPFYRFYRGWTNFLCGGPIESLTSNWCDFQEQLHHATKNDTHLIVPISTYTTRAKRVSQREPRP